MFLLSKTKNEATKKATEMFSHFELSVDSKIGINVREIWRIWVEIMEKQAKTAISSI